MNLASYAKKHLSGSVRQRIAPVAKVLYRKNLNVLAKICGTDKWGSHFYTQHYQRYFAPLRTARLNLLEIGVGGYEDSNKGGGSLRMWKAFFPNARIVGIDIADKTHFSEPRIDIRICDQTDAVSLKKLSEEYGGFDIIIDDGSHLNEHVIQTFHILFPLLRANGIYVVEDTQTAYWPGYGGGRNSPATLAKFFQGLTDGLNYDEYLEDEYRSTYFDRNIVEMAFFHNMIVIRKGDNDEGSTRAWLFEPERAEAELKRSGSFTIHYHGAGEE